jgi:hypothetical protein
MIDVPTLYADGGNGRGNYATYSPLEVTGNTSRSFSNGNLRVTATGINGEVYMTNFPLPPASKIYAEFTLAALGGPSAATLVGISAFRQQYRKDGSIWKDGVSQGTFAAMSVGGVAAMAIDTQANTIQFFYNGASQTTITPTDTLSGGFIYHYLTASGDAWDANFGQRPFAYTPPTGFKALNTQNLPAPSILKGNQYFDATLWTGNGTSQTITNNGSMQPDLVWAKSRSAATGHILADAVRGASLVLQTNNTNAEVTATDHVTSFNSNGFSIGNGGSINVNTSTYVGWQWKANGSAVTNTSGSITSQVNAGTSQGFSVVTWTGTGSTATVGHGLGVAPAMIIMKNRTQGAAGYNWAVYHKSISSASAFVDLNTTAGAGTNTGIWNATAPTSTVFSVGTARINNGDLNVAYCFSEVAGFSKFGSYTGNGSADGPFVFCGFRPRFVMIKRTDSSSVNGWYIWDTARNPSNTANLRLYPNSSSAEVTGNSNELDILSSGFKLRFDGSDFNASGGTYIFAAFAENPFKNSLAR